MENPQRSGAALGSARSLLLIPVLGALSAFGPMSIDMYLPALPSIAEDLGASAANVQLTLSAFFFGFGGGQLLYGPLADRFGRRRPLLLGLSVFTAASLGCAVATGIGTLIALRFLQALGGCAGSVLARAMVRDLYGRDSAARVLSLIMLTMSLAPLIAPFIGAQLLLLAGWRSIFWLVAGFGGLCIAAALLVTGETLPAERRLRISLFALVRSYAAPLGNARYLGYAVGSALVYGGLFAYITGSPFVLITLFGVRPEYYSLLFGMNVIGIMLAASVNSRAVIRIGTDRLLGLGLRIAAGAGCLVLLAAATGLGGLPALVIPIFFFIGSIGIVGANSMAGALELFPRNAGAASALAGTLQFVTGAISSTLVSALDNGTALPMAGVMALAGVLSLAVGRAAAR